MRLKDIVQWQADLKASKSVFGIYERGDHGCQELSSDLYETREGAEMHVSFMGERRRNRCRVVELKIHTDDLARRRWVEND